MAVSQRCDTHVEGMYKVEVPGNPAKWITLEIEARDWASTLKMLEEITIHARRMAAEPQSTPRDYAVTGAFIDYDAFLQPPAFAAQLEKIKRQEAAELHELDLRHQAEQEAKALRIQALTGECVDPAEAWRYNEEALKYGFSLEAAKDLPHAGSFSLTSAAVLEALEGLQTLRDNLYVSARTPFDDLSEEIAQEQTTVELSQRSAILGFYREAAYDAERRGELALAERLRTTAREADILDDEAFQAWNLATVHSWD